MASLAEQFAADAAAGGAAQPQNPQGSLAAQFAADAASGAAPAPAVPAKPAGNGIGLARQLGLTARYGLEGAGDTLDTLASPIRGALNLALPDSMQARPGAFSRLSDSLGLPSPQTPQERIVGDASRMVAGAAVPVGIGGAAASRTAGATKAVADMAASNPGMQLISGASSGAAGGYARENGSGDGEQLTASLLGGVVAPLGLDALASGGRSLASMAGNFLRPATSPQVVNVTISNALRDTGMNFGDLAPHVQSGMQRDVQAALDAGNQVSPDAIRRLADFRLTGTTPTAASVTLDPAIVTQQRNLAKLGINSKDATAQQLGQVENANNRQIISNLNDLGAGTADRIGGAQTIMGALEARNQTAKGIIGQRYDAARGMDGRSADLSPSHFAQGANDLLDQALLGGKLPGDVRNLLNQAATGKMPLTVDTAEQFKTRIGDLQRSSTDPAERKALGLVRQALDNTPLLDPAQMGQPAIDAFNRARGLNRAWMSIVDKTPALQAVRDGLEPDKFVQQFIVGNGPTSNVMDVAMLKNSIKSNPDAMAAVKGQIVSYLKGQALNGAADEVGNVSSSALNKALNNIGDRKLALFFSPEEINALKANGRVASYDQFQPRGSAVNNSNTAGTGLAAILDRVANSPLLSKIPGGAQFLAQPVQNISVGMQASRAMNMPAAIAGQRASWMRPPAGLLISPAVAVQPQDDRRGLLSP